MRDIINYILEKGKAVVKKGKELALPAAAGTYLLLSPLMGTAKAEEPTVPKLEPAAIIAKADPKKPKITLDAWVEDFSVVDTDGDDSHTQRIEVINKGNDRFFRADHTTVDGGFEKWRVGMRPKYNLGDLISGKLGVFGSLDNADNHAIGAEWIGTIAEVLRLGFELEKVHNSGTDSRLFRAHVSVNPLDNLTLQFAGYEKDGAGHLQIVGYGSLKDQKMFLGLAGDIQEGLKGKLTGCIAHTGPKKGEGIGFKLWGRTNFDGNHLGQLLVQFGDNYTLKGHEFFFDIVDGIQDVTTKEKINRFRAAPLYAYASRAIVRLTASHAKDGTMTYAGEAYIRTGDLLGKDVNLVAGGKCTRVDLPGQKAQDMYQTLLGVKAGPVCLEYYCGFGKGMKPVHMIFVGTSARDVYDALAGTKKK